MAMASEAATSVVARHAHARRATGCVLVAIPRSYAWAQQTTPGPAKIFPGARGLRCWLWRARYLMPVFMARSERGDPLRSPK